MSDSQIAYNRLRLGLFATFSISLLQTRQLTTAMQIWHTWLDILQETADLKTHHDQIMDRHSTLVYPFVKHNTRLLIKSTSSAFGPFILST